MPIAHKKRHDPRCRQCVAIVFAFGILVALIGFATPLASDVKDFRLQQLQAFVAGSGGDSNLQSRVQALEQVVQDLRLQVLACQGGAARQRLTSISPPARPHVTPSSPPPAGHSLSRSTGASGDSSNLALQSPDGAPSDVGLAKPLRSKGSFFEKASPAKGATLQASWATSLHTGLCEGNRDDSVNTAHRNATWEFQKMRQGILERYTKIMQKISISMAFGAVHELERCGARAEREFRNIGDPARSKYLRQDLLSQLRRVHKEHLLVYKQARGNITDMLKYKSKHGRVKRAIPEEISRGHWIMSGGSGEHCIQACQREGQYCDVSMMENIVSEETMATAVHATGNNCMNYEELIMYTSWDGPWFHAGHCTFSPYAFTDCTLPILKGLSRLCACSDKLGPVRAPFRPGMFSHIIPALPLWGTELLRTGVHGGVGGDDRVLVGSDTLNALGHECIVYDFGVAYEFGHHEEHLLRLGCIIHAFDCTMLNGERMMKYLNMIAEFPNMIYHPWCYGEHDSSYKGWDGETTGIFLGLEEIMTKLGHEEVDIMKFDIEGNEWKLFDQLLKTSKDLLPFQLAFEVHTYGANQRAVPQDLVGEKGERETAELFDQLYDAGYMLVSKEVNGKDPSCAEMLMVRV